MDPELDEAASAEQHPRRGLKEVQRIVQTSDSILATLDQPDGDQGAPHGAGDPGLPREAELLVGQLVGPVLLAQLQEGQGRL